MLIFLLYIWIVYPFIKYIYDHFTTCYANLGRVLKLLPENFVRRKKLRDRTKQEMHFWPQITVTTVLKILLQHIGQESVYYLQKDSTYVFALFLLNQVLSRNEMWSFYYSAESYFYYSTYPYHGTRSEQRYEI